MPRWPQALGLWRHMAMQRAACDATALTAVVTGLRPAGEWREALGATAAL